MEDDGWLTAGAGESRSTERRYTVTSAGRARARGLDREGHAASRDAFRGRREDARGVVRRPGSAARPARAAGRRAPDAPGALRAARARAVPRPGLAHRPAARHLAGAARRASSRSSSGSSGSASTSTPTGSRRSSSAPQPPLGRHERLPPPPGADHDRRPHPAQPGGDGLDAHRPGGLRVGHPQAGGVLRRARPRWCRPDRHRRLRADQARLAQAVRERPDLAAAVRAAQAGHRCRARGRGRDRAPGAARRSLRLHAVLPVRERPQVTDHPVPAERDVDQAGRPDGHRLRRVRRAGASARGTTPSRSWAPRAT